MHGKQEPRRTKDTHASPVVMDVCHIARQSRTQSYAGQSAVKMKYQARPGGCAQRYEAQGHTPSRTG